MSINLSSLVITPEILKIIAEIDEFKGAWQFFSRITPERLQALRKIATIESVGSSTRIEGAKLSDREVEALLTNIKGDSFRSRDEQEVAGYAYVCRQIFDNYTSINLTENMIKQLHLWLLKYSDKDERHRGEYKKLPNNVEAFDESGKSLGIIFETSSPFETSLKMQELIHWLRESLESKTLHPILVIAIFIVVFLAVHPFQDGNGRLSRILTTLLLLKADYLYVPYVSLESIIEENKESYYLALRRTQQSLNKQNPDWIPWLLFFLQSLHKHKCRLEEKISNEKILNLHISELSAQILILIRDHGRLSASQLEKLTQANRNTLKKHLQQLVRSKQLLQHGKGKSTWYTST